MVAILVIVVLLVLLNSISYYTLGLEDAYADLRRDD